MMIKFVHVLVFIRSLAHSPWIPLDDLLRLFREIYEETTGILKWPLQGLYRALNI